MAAVGPSIAEIYVLRKMAKQKKEEIKKIEIHTDTSVQSCTKSQFGCFSWIQKKIHPSSLPTTKT
ncbi:unnamed protein product [Amaranthus hypochondriacus]